MDIFVIILFIVIVLFAYIIGRMVENRKWQQGIKYIRKESVEKSRDSLSGKFAENLAPYFPDFKHDPTEIKFVGSPIDYIVFKGLSKKEPEEIIFLEIKSGDSTLSDVQKKLKKIIEEKKVYWDEYRVPKQITRKED